jgi:hypothetical protein
LNISELQDPFFLKVITILAVLLIIGVFSFFIIQLKRKKYQSFVPIITDADKILNRGFPREALDIYEDLSKEFYPYEAPKIYAHVRKNMGLCYYQIAEKEKTSEKREEYLDKALSFFEDALKIYTLKKYPLSNARILVIMGDIYRQIGIINNKEVNLLRSVQLIETALSVVSAQKNSLDYAKAKRNIGETYLALSLKDNKKDNLEKAKLSLIEAEKAISSEIYPDEYVKIKAKLDELEKNQ